MKFEHCVNGIEDEDFEIQTYFKAVRKPQYDNDGDGWPYAVVIEMYTELGDIVNDGVECVYHKTEQSAAEYIEEYNK